MDVPSWFVIIECYILNAFSLTKFSEGEMCTIWERVQEFSPFTHFGPASICNHKLCDNAFVCQKFLN